LFKSLVIVQYLSCTKTAVFKVKTIFETIEQASKSRVTFDQAEQQIKGINADGELQPIKTNALQMLTTTKGEIDNPANDNAAEQVKAFRRACVPL
jgi:hypothetical protein